MKVVIPQPCKARGSTSGKGRRRRERSADGHPEGGVGRGRRGGPKVPGGEKEKRGE